MKSTWSKIVTHSFLFIGFAAGVSACGNKSSSSASGPQGTQVAGDGYIFSGGLNAGGYSNFDMSSYAIIIKNARAVKVMKEQSDDNPDYFSINGQLIKRREVRRLLKSGQLQAQTLCMTRFSKMPRQGDILALTKSVGGAYENSSQIYWATLQARRFSLVCTKLGSALSLSEIRNSVRGIISIDAYEAMNGVGQQGYQNLQPAIQPIGHQGGSSSPEILPYSQNQGW